MNKSNLSLILSIVAVLAVIFTLYNSIKSPRLVYVDINKLIDGFHGSKVAKEDFDKKVSVMKANVDSLMTGWQNELKTYEKERSSMSPKELQLKQELLSNKQSQINNYQQGVQKQISEEDKKITQTVLNDINSFVKEYGESNGYKIIFGASGSGNIMYADESTDLTQDVLKKLNEEYDGK